MKWQDHLAGMSQALCSEDHTAGAVFVGLRYRTLLWRQWSDKPPLGWIMLNPSTATHEVLDPTVTRCCKRSEFLGYGGCLVANLSPYRATDPKEMDRAFARGVDMLLPGVNQSIFELLGSVCHQAIVVAWGAGVRPWMHPAIASVGRLFPRLLCLGVTAKGFPRHPLYVPGTQPLVPWRSPNDG